MLLQLRVIEQKPKMEQSSLPPHKCAFILQHRPPGCTSPSSASAKLPMCSIRHGHLQVFLSAVSRLDGKNVPAGSNFCRLCGAARLADTSEGDMDAQRLRFNYLCVST